MADSDRRVVCAPLRSATTRRKKELDKARLATRVTLKNQKGRWDRLKTVLKMKDSEVADFNEITYICHCPRNARHLSVALFHAHAWINYGGKELAH